MKKYLTFFFTPYGSITRLEFFLTAIIAYVSVSLLIIVLLIFGIAQLNLSEEQISGLSVIGGIAIGISFLFTCIRRCRDIGWSPWYNLCLIVPYLNIGFLLSLLFTPSWNQQKGGRYLYVLCKKMAEVDGPTNQHEVKSFTSFINQTFPPNTPEELAQKVRSSSLQFFEKGHSNPFTSYQYVLEKFVEKGLPSEEDKLFIFNLLKSIAEADGDMVESESQLLEMTLEVFNIKEGMPLGYEFLIGMLAKLAKADGVVSREEINLIEDFFQNGLQLIPKQRSVAIEAFKIAKKSPHKFEYYALQFKKIHYENVALLELAMGLLLELALADDEISDEEIKLLDQAAVIFNIENKHQSTNQSGNREQYQTQEAEYARVLGIDIDTPFAEIKKRYRSLIATNHPDKVSGLSDAIKNAAEHESKRIIEAYDFFKRKNKHA